MVSRLIKDQFKIFIEDLINNNKIIGANRFDIGHMNPYDIDSDLKDHNTKKTPIIISIDFNVKEGKVKVITNDWIYSLNEFEAFGVGNKAKDIITSKLILQL